MSDFEKKIKYSICIRFRVRRVNDVLKNIFPSELEWRNSWERENLRWRKSGLGRAADAHKTCQMLPRAGQEGGEGEVYKNYRNEAVTK